MKYVGYNVEKAKVGHRPLSKTALAIWPAAAVVIQYWCVHAATEQSFSFFPFLLINDVCQPVSLSYYHLRLWKQTNIITDV